MKKVYIMYDARAESDTEDAAILEACALSMILMKVKIRRKPLMKKGTEFMGKCEEERYKNSGDGSPGASVAHPLP